MPRILRFIYVSPKLPCISAVFQQNEILGIQGLGLAVRVVSCRRPSTEDQRRVHTFARPILDITLQPTLLATISGAVEALRRRPAALVRVLGWTVRAVRNLVAFPRVVGACLVALGAWQRLRHDGADWIHADFGQNSATVALFLSELLGAPFSFKVHAFDIFMTNLAQRDPLRRLKVECARVVYSEHEHGRRVLDRLVPGSARKTVLNYTAVRTAEFRPLPPLAESRRFLALGRLVPKKGLDVLVRAAAELHARDVPVTIDIFGSGPEEATLRSLIRQHGLESVVRLRGAYRNDDLPDLLEDCVAVVVPSVIGRHGDMDGVPTVIYEALALGRPVIASALSGIPEVVRDGVNGRLVPAADPARLADAMLDLLENPDRAARLGREGRRVVETRHDSRLAAAEMVRAMESALEAVAPRAASTM